MQSTSSVSLNAYSPLERPNSTLLLNAPARLVPCTQHSPQCQCRPESSTQTRKSKGKTRRLPSKTSLKEWPNANAARTASDGERGRGGAPRQTALKTMPRAVPRTANLCGRGHRRPSVSPCNHRLSTKPRCRSPVSFSPMSPPLSSRPKNTSIHAIDHHSTANSQTTPPIKLPGKWELERGNRKDLK